MKTFFSVVAGLLLALPAFGQSVLTTNVAGRTSFLLLSGGGSVNSLQLVGGTNAVTLTFYDNNADDTTYTNAAYTRPYSYTTTLTSNYVTLTGITNYYTNSVIMTTNRAYAAATNTLPALGTYYVPASTLVTVTDPAIMFGKGVVVGTSSSNNSAQVIMTYSTWR